MDLEGFGESRYVALASEPENRQVACDKAEALAATLKHPTLTERVPELISVVRREGLSLRVVVAAAAALIYFVSPVDVIPDVVPVLGFLDDIGVIAAVANYVLGCMSGTGSSSDRKAAIPNTEVPYDGAANTGGWEDPFVDSGTQETRNPFLDSDWTPSGAPTRSPFSPDRPVARNGRNPFSR